MQCQDRAFRSARSGFTLVEILVVVVIIAILISMVLVGGGAVIAGAKERHTRSLFGILDQAVTEYTQDSKQSLVPGASKVFGDYPPDNIYVFDGANNGVDVGKLGLIRMAPTSASILPPRDANPGLGDVRVNGLLQRASHRGFGDIRAMVLAMRLRSPRASAMLDRIDQVFVGLAEEDEYYDPGEGQNTPLDYYVDAWGTPIEYYSTKAVASGFKPRTRAYASQHFVRLNNGKPLFVSYGPNGQEQFDSDYLVNESFDSSMVGDFSDYDGDGIINNELNDDNVYSTEFIAPRLREGAS